jgi:hypothetical protein
MTPFHGDPAEIAGLLIERLTSASPRQQRAALVAMSEFETLDQGTAPEQDSAWYYLHFGLGWTFATKPHGTISTTHGKRKTPREVAAHLGVGSEAPHYLAVSPAGRLTTWAVADIDSGSRYHPASVDGEGIEPVKDALALIGLVEPLEIQSSDDRNGGPNGIHLWYPLAEATHTLTLARQMESACRSAGIEIRDGVLELRPNDKTGPNFKTIRAPLTGEGNALWCGEGHNWALCEELARFRQEWERVQGANRLAPLPGNLLNTRGQLPPRGKNTGRLRAAQKRLAEGFTGPCQTEELKLAALQVAGLVEGLGDPERIRDRCAALVSQAPGFTRFCRSQREILSGRAWCRRSLDKAAAMAPGGYAGTWQEAANKRSADEATSRALKALGTAQASGTLYRSELAAVTALKALGGPARSWWYKSPNIAALEAMRSLVSPSPLEAHQAV